MNSHRFLIINPFGIGDVLFTTPLIRAIKDTYPDAYIGYWCNARVEPILKDNPGIDKTFALSRGDIKKIFRQSWYRGILSFWGLLPEIKKERFDVALDFSLDHRYGLIAKLLGIKRRIGFNYKNRGRFLTDKIEIDGYNDKHVVEYYLELLGLLKIKPLSRQMELFISEADKIKSKDILSSCGIRDDALVIGIAPGAGASWGKDAQLKHWPADNFARLADRVIDELSAKVIFLGDISERKIADKTINSMHNKAIDLIGRTSLGELAAVIDNLDILITNDGGPLHMAGALGKKTVSFFGPVDPLVYGPYPADEKKHIVLKKDLACSPCYVKFHLSGCGNNQECLKGIEVESAFNAVKSLLSGKEDIT